MIRTETRSSKPEAVTRRARMATIAAAAASLIAAATLYGQSTTAPTKTREFVTTLASDRFEGRLTGSNGEKLASDYLVSQLRRIGAKPLPGQTDFLEPFE